MTSKSLHYEGIIYDPKLIIPTTKGYIVYPKALNIIWGNDERFWKLPKNNTDAAELMQVNWLEVTGCIDNNNIERKASYEIKFTMSFMMDAFGWSDSPIYLMAKWGKNTQWRKVNMASHDINDKNPISKTIMITYKGNGNDTDKIYFELYEVWNKKWKGGLKIHRVSLTKTSELEKDVDQSLT